MQDVSAGSGETGEPAENQVISGQMLQAGEEEAEAGGRELDIPSEEEVLAYIDNYLDSVEEDKINLADIGRVLKQKYLGLTPETTDTAA